MLDSKRKTRKWILVVGARANFMKVAPIIWAIKVFNEANGTNIIPFLIHTGQHYDLNMSDSFFKDLNLPEPNIYLGVGSGTHGEQTGKVLVEFEKVLIMEEPNLVIVVGDVNSPLAYRVAASKLHIPVAHVEAGLRSFDRKMPEEINRVVTDSLSEFLFTPSSDGDENLLKEGIPSDKIFLVGDIMVDSLLFNLQQAKKKDTLERLNLRTDHKLKESNQQSIRPYALLTLQRPANVDNEVSMERIIHGLLEVSSRIPIIFPMHPKTRKQVTFFGMEYAFEFHSSIDLSKENYYHDGALKRLIHCFEHLDYLDFLNLMAQSTIVLIESGGIQQETTVLNIPCITLRDTTERPITLTEGTNVLVHHDEEKIVSE